MLDDKNKKGFTMVELLAVVVILGIIAGIGVPLVSRYLDKARNNAYDHMFTASYDAANNIILDENMSCITSECYFKLSNLVDKGYIEDLADPGNQGSTCDGMIEVSSGVSNSETLDAYSYICHLRCSSYSKTVKWESGAAANEYNVVSDEEAKNLEDKFSNDIDNIVTITADIDPKTGDLHGGKVACFTVSVNNAYSNNRNFKLTSSNENLLLINSDGSALNDFEISANTTKEYEVCTKAAPSSIFLADEATTIITLESAGIDNVNLGRLTFDVDKDLIATDKEIPIVGNVKITNDTTLGDAVVSWNRIDKGGSSITNYYIILYNADTGTTTTYQTDSALTYYKLSNLSEGKYYAKVYGVDEAGNIGASYCDAATSDNGYCSVSNTESLEWIYKVTYELSNLNHDNLTSATDTATGNKSYTTTLSTSSSSYSLPSSITVKMGGIILTSDTDYTYDSTTGTIYIKKITNDVTISAKASGGDSCLIEGTQIALANGKTKNIEDVSYDDLLLVWNYETGSYTYEYPIWIEKGNVAYEYQKITFSDGSILKTYGSHGVYSKELNKFISVTDKDNFKIGTEIAKIDNNKITYVKVSNIEIISEKTNYYQVVSTRYFNVIANDILTTDGTVLVSNLYEFDSSDIKWLDRNSKLLELYTYDDFKDIMPYYLYKGLRIEEGKVISKYLNYNDLRKYLIVSPLNDNMLLPPITDPSNSRLWMVTTSDDIISNKNSYLRKEGSYYILREPIRRAKFKYWYNTSDGKKYKPNSVVRVTHGMHFIAVYE